MTIFLLPTTLQDEMQQNIELFLVGFEQKHGKGINCLSWEHLSMRKEHGGMGFCHLYAFNLVMLGKQSWKFLYDNDVIVTKVFKAK